MGAINHKGANVQHSAEPRYIPEYPAGAPETLQRIFNLTIREFAMLAACDRDDKFRFGCAPRDCSRSDVEILNKLEARVHVEYSRATGKWELTVLGRAVLDVAQLLIRYRIPSPDKRPGKVVEFPRKPTITG